MSGTANESLFRRIRFVAFDFDGVFTDNAVYLSEEGLESVRCCRSDGIGLARLREAGIEAVVLSTEPNPVVRMRCEKLGIPCEHGLSDKHRALARRLADRDLSWEEAAFVGNDVNDLACLSAVGLPIVVADAHPDVRDKGIYVTRAPGGHGAVREVCDLLVEARR